MCTVSWTVRRGGYDLFFNLDELNTRAPESEPTVARANGVAYLAPRDGDHGGTWLLANELGRTVCLLNDYGVAWRPDVSRCRNSRGRVVLACAAAGSHDELIAAVEAQPLAATPAFQMVALSADEGPLVLHWRGVRLERQSEAETIALLTSSSFATKEVIGRRLRRFSLYVRSPANATPEELFAYHQQHAPEAGAESVLMRRSDAATRSMIHVGVGKQEVRLDYHAVDRFAETPTMLPPTMTVLPRRCLATRAA